MNNYCRNCGNKIIENEKNCNICGAEVLEERINVEQESMELIKFKNKEKKSLLTIALLFAALVISNFIPFIQNFSILIGISFIVYLVYSKVNLKNSKVINIIFIIFIIYTNIMLLSIIVFLITCTGGINRWF